MGAKYSFYSVYFWQYYDPKNCKYNPYNSVAPWKAKHQKKIHVKTAVIFHKYAMIKLLEFFCGMWFLKLIKEGDLGYYRDIWG